MSKNILYILFWPPDIDIEIDYDKFHLVTSMITKEKDITGLLQSKDYYVDFSENDEIFIDDKLICQIIERKEKENGISFEEIIFFQLFIKKGNEDEVLLLENNIEYQGVHLIDISSKYPNKKCLAISKIMVMEEKIQIIDDDFLWDKDLLINMHISV